jgi:hypothetical protein
MNAYRIRFFAAALCVLIGSRVFAQNAYASDSVSVTTTVNVHSTTDPDSGYTACYNATRALRTSQNYDGCEYGVSSYLEPNDVTATIQTRTRHPGGVYTTTYRCAGTCTAVCAPPGNSGGTDTQCPGYCCPLLVDLGDHGYDLTSAAEGVAFDIDADGVSEAISWTAAGAADAFLALDRNGNGTIDSGAELFGANAEQPASAKPNGFAALAMFDRTDRGGNGDDVISAQDDVWPSLLLWVDRSHDGIAQSDELAPVAASGLNVLELDYKQAQRRDRYGNRYLYRSSALAEGGLRKVDVMDVFFVPFQ